ncbi:MAG: hypothetical protein ACK5UI_03605 [Bacteroidota bacterium]
MRRKQVTCTFEPATYESRFAMTSNFGYLGLVGYRNKKWGALGGVDFR